MPQEKWRIMGYQELQEIQQALSVNDKALRALSARIRWVRNPALDQRTRYGYLVGTESTGWAKSGLTKSRVRPQGLQDAYCGHQARSDIKGTTGEIKITCSYSSDENYLRLVQFVSFHASYHPIMEICRSNKIFKTEDIEENRRAQLLRWLSLTKRLEGICTQSRQKSKLRERGAKF
jgi:hypothetical protein